MHAWHLSGLLHLWRLEQAHADLHAAPLAIRDPVHAPLWVYVQHLHDLGPPGLVDAWHAFDHLASRDVALHPARCQTLAAAPASCIARDHLTQWHDTRLRNCQAVTSMATVTPSTSHIEIPNPGTAGTC